MSIFGPADTVTAADIAGLEDSIQFFQSSVSNQAAVAGAIQIGTTTVAAYAAQLLNANISLSQAAMGVSCIELGVAQTTAELDILSTGFLPAQVQNAVSHGLVPTVYAAETTGLALAGEPEFAAFTGLTERDFSIQVSGLTGILKSVILGWVTFWIGFYTANPGSTFGLTVTQAAYGAALGDAVGVALLNPTSADLQTVITTNVQGETTIQGDPANHLLDIATGQYVPGIDCDLLPEHTALQGEAGTGTPGGLRLTVNVDFLMATTEGAVFDASPMPNPPLDQDNTLNSGDELQDPLGDGTLNFATAQNNFTGLINPPFAQDVTMNGISDANILSQDFGGDPAGFSGAISGLLNVTVLAGSTADVAVGEFNLGLLTALENITINASVDFEVWIASAAFAGGEAVGLTLNGVDTFVELDVASGTNFYAQVDIHSEIADNFLTLVTNADTIATITADGDQDLDVDGNALFMDTLELFDGTNATGAITAFFGGTGDVTVNGGSNNDDFTFAAGNGAVTVNGNDGDDALSGGKGADVLNGGAGNDAMDGGEGDDVFIFAAGFGNDRVLGFDANPKSGQDLLDIKAFGITSATFAARVKITDEGADTRVTIDGDAAQTILLIGMSDATAVTQADFLL